MKKTYSSPNTILFNIGTTATILAGSPVGTKVKEDENASTEQPVLSRETPLHFSVWDDEEEQ